MQVCDALYVNHTPTAISERSASLSQSDREVSAGKKKRNIEENLEVQPAVNRRRIDGEENEEDRVVL